MENITNILYRTYSNGTHSFVEAIAYDLITHETYTGEGTDEADAKRDLEREIKKARKA